MWFLVCGLILPVSIWLLILWFNAEFYRVIIIIFAPVNAAVITFCTPTSWASWSVPYADLLSVFGSAILQFLGGWLFAIFAFGVVFAIIGQLLLFDTCLWIRWFDASNTFLGIGQRLGARPGVYPASSFRVLITQWKVSAFFRVSLAIETSVMSMGWAHKLAGTRFDGSVGASLHGFMLR